MINIWTVEITRVGLSREAPHFFEIRNEALRLLADIDRMWLDSEYVRT